MFKLLTLIDLIVDNEGEAQIQEICMKWIRQYEYIRDREENNSFGPCPLKRTAVVRKQKSAVKCQ